MARATLASSETEARDSGLRTGLGWLGQLLAWMVILAVTTMLVATVGVPRATGATPYGVLTGSMRPELPPGSLVIVRPTAAADIGVGDVITYQLESGRPEVVTHRVVAVAPSEDGTTLFQHPGRRERHPRRALGGRGPDQRRRVVLAALPRTPPHPAHRKGATDDGLRRRRRSFSAMPGRCSPARCATGAGGRT